MRCLLAFFALGIFGCGLAGASSSNGFGGSGGVNAGGSGMGLMGGNGGTPAATGGASSTASGGNGTGGNVTGSGGAPGTGGAATSASAGMSSSTGPAMCSPACGACQTCVNGQCMNASAGSMPAGCLAAADCGGLQNTVCECNAMGQCKVATGSFCGMDGDCASGSCTGKCADSGHAPCKDQSMCNAYPNEQCNLKVCD